MATMIADSSAGFCYEANRTPSRREAGYRLVSCDRRPYPPVLAALGAAAWRRISCARRACTRNVWCLRKALASGPRRDVPGACPEVFYV